MTLSAAGELHPDVGTGASVSIDPGGAKGHHCRDGELRAPRRHKAVCERGGLGVRGASGACRLHRRDLQERSSPSVSFPPCIWPRDAYALLSRNIKEELRIAEKWVGIEKFYAPLLTGLCNR